MMTRIVVKINHWHKVCKNLFNKFKNKLVNFFIFSKEFTKEEQDENTYDFLFPTTNNIALILRYINYIF